MRILGAMMMLTAALACAGSLSAQTYTRTTPAGVYTPRTGAGVTVQSVVHTNFFNVDNAVQVRLPFAFPFFDRTYNTAWMQSDGRVSFTAANTSSASNASLVTPVADVTQHEGINVFRTNLGWTKFDAQPMAIYFETGRVVFQWNNVRAVGFEGVDSFNFQCHILSTGEIILAYGPEVNNFAETITFVSGIVNAGGTAAFAGFGGVLTQQTIRPSANAFVSLVPSGFMMGNGVEVGPIDNNDADLTAISNTNDVVIGRFGLTAHAAGGTVTQIVVGHTQVGTGEPVTLRLFRDNAPLNVFDAGDTQVGTTQTPSGVASSTFGGLSQAITTGTTPYLLVANFGTLSNVLSQLGLTSVASTGITTAATAWGGYISRVRWYQSGPNVTFNSSLGRGIQPMLAGETNRALLSFEARRGRLTFGPPLDYLNQVLFDFGATTMTTMSFTLNLGTIVIADIAEVRLYRDGGTRGVLDGSDVQLGTATSPATTTISFAGLSEVSSASGVDYLLTVSLVASPSANGTISAAPNYVGFVGSVAGSQFNSSGQSTGTVFPVLAAAPVILALPRFDSLLANQHCRPNDTNRPTVCFTLQTNTGTATVTQLQFGATSDATTYLSAARLFIDNGTTGRLDGADVQVGGAGTIAATTITFSGLTQSIGTARTTYLLVVDIAAGAAVSSPVLNLGAAGITSATTVAGGGGTSTIAIQAGSGNGIDVTGFSMSSSLNFGGNQVAVLASIQLTPRGTGGFAPQIIFDVITAAGGTGNNDGVNTISYLEGAGPLGQLDPTDVPINSTQEQNIDTDDSVPVATNASTNGLVNTVRNFLIVVYRDDMPIDGSATLVFRGMTGGTDVRYVVAIPGPTNTVIVLQNVAVGGGGGGGGDDGGGCSTGASDSRVNLVLLASLLGVMFVGMRLRRRVA